MALHRLSVSSKSFTAIALKELPLRANNHHVKQFSLLSSQSKGIGLRGLKRCGGHLHSSRSLHELSADEVDIEVVAEGTGGTPPTDFNSIRFGSLFSDHMLSVEWTADHGWHKPKIHTLRPFDMHPAAKVLHYAPELFEGMKE